MRPLLQITTLTFASYAHILTGKQWHAQKAAFRPKAGLTSYTRRTEERKSMATMKAKEKEMRDEKEAERQVQLMRFCTK